MRAIRESDKKLLSRLPFVGHGEVTLPDVVVESYSVVISADGKIVGDKIGKSAFAKTFERLRKEASRPGHDPFGKALVPEVNQQQWAKWLAEGSTEKGAIINEAVDQFAADLAAVIKKFRQSDDEWRKLEEIVIGGGFSSGRVGRITIARAQQHLERDKIKCILKPIPQNPDVAGVSGAAYLAPGWMFSGFDAILGVDIGGTNIRCGAVMIKTNSVGQVTRAKPIFPEFWRHADDEPSRTEAINELIEMLKKIVQRCKKEEVHLAPFIGVGCPGRIRPDGTIDRGAHTLPGQWDKETFNLPAVIGAQVSITKRQDTVVVMHNDAVVQGLSQIPAMRKQRNWAILTIGTGLGNAKFTGRHYGRGSQG